MGKIKNRITHASQAEFGDFSHIYDSFERINGSYLPLDLNFLNFANDRFTRFNTKVILKSQKLTFQS